MEGYYQAHREANHIANENGFFSRIDFFDSLLDYLDLSIDDAMKSDNQIIVALSMFDRRLGKRRLQKLEEPTHTLIKKFYKIRCDAEGIITKVV